MLYIYKYALKGDIYEQTVCGSHAFCCGVFLRANIPVEVIGLPHSYQDICGNHALDYLIEDSHKMISTGQSSQFVNFKIDKFVYEFRGDGSLILKTVYSYDQTPAGGNRFYPAAKGRISSVLRRRRRGRASSPAA